MDEKGFIRRIHQEDFAQALGLSPELKYQRRGTDGRRIDASAVASLLAKTEQPSTSVLQFLKFTLFDLLIGNVDAHAKNHAVIYYSGRIAPRLAPRYDLLPTRMEQNITEQLSYDIGAAQYIETVDGVAVAKFMSSFGIATARGQKRILSERLSKLVLPLAANLEILQSLGQKSFADLIATNMRLLLPKFDFPIPAEAQSQDTFILRGGG